MMPLRHPGWKARAVQIVYLMGATALLTVAVTGPGFLEDISDEIPSILATDTAFNEAEALVRCAVAIAAIALLRFVNWADVAAALLLTLVTIATVGLVQDLKNSEEPLAAASPVRATFDARVTVPSEKITGTGEALKANTRAFVIMTLPIRSDEGRLRMVDRHHELALRTPVDSGDPTADVLVDVRRGVRDRQLAGFVRHLDAAKTVRFFPRNPTR